MSARSILDLMFSVLENIRWSAIAARLPGRTDNEIKNYWNTHIRKRLLRNGIDPVTHAPRLDLLDLSSILSSALCNQSLVNVSSLLGTQALLNPDLVRLANTLLSLKQENPEVLLQYLQQNHLCNSQIQNLAPTPQQSQFQQAPAQEASTCTTSTPPCTSFVNQTELLQANGEVFSSNTSNFLCQNRQQNLPSSCSTDTSFLSQPNYVHCSSTPTVPLLPDQNSNFQSVDGGQNFSFDSVMSTPMSSPTPLNSSSTFINSSSTEDERESYSSLLKFEIPESLMNINDFIM